MHTQVTFKRGVKNTCRRASAANFIRFLVHTYKLLRQTTSFQASQQCNASRWDRENGGIVSVRLRDRISPSTASFESLCIATLCKQLKHPGRWAYRPAARSRANLSGGKVCTAGTLHVGTTWTNAWKSGNLGIKLAKFAAKRPPSK